MRNSLSYRVYTPQDGVSCSIAPTSRRSSAPKKKFGFFSAFFFVMTVAGSIGGATYFAQKYIDGNAKLGLSASATTTTVGTIAASPPATETDPAPVGSIVTPTPVPAPEGSATTPVGSSSAKTPPAPPAKKKVLPPRRRPAAPAGPGGPTVPTNPYED